MKRFAMILVLVLLACACLPALADTELAAVTCAEGGFSTKVPTDCTAQYTEGTGLQIYTDVAGYIPYVIISPRPADKQFSDPTNYLNNVYREYMEEKYGESMLGTNPARKWEIGGKKLIGARYLYQVSDATVCLLRLIEQREDGYVEYTAKFIVGEDEKTMEVLDAAVRYYSRGGADSAPAAPEALRPVDMSAIEVDTNGGVYWAAITDTDRVTDGGFFTARLYYQSLYPAAAVEALSENAKIVVNGWEFTVEKLVHHDEKTVEIYPKEAFDGYIVLNKASDYFYTALVNDWVPCTHIADQKIMLPLANDFTFLWLSGDEEATVYDADAFIKLLDEAELNQYNTQLQYSSGLVMMIVHTSYPFGPEAEVTTQPTAS